MDSLVQIHNVTDYAWGYKYILARRVEEENNELWFWGAYDDITEANKYAKRLRNGEVYPTSEVDPNFK